MRREVIDESRNNEKKDNIFSILHGGLYLIIKYNQFTRVAQPGQRR